MTTRTAIVKPRRAAPLPPGAKAEPEDENTNDKAPASKKNEGTEEAGTRKKVTILKKKVFLEEKDEPNTNAKRRFT